jgi:hypothetical protein
MPTIKKKTKLFDYSISKIVNGICLYTTLSDADFNKKTDFPNYNISITVYRGYGGRIFINIHTTRTIVISIRNDRKPYFFSKGQINKIIDIFGSIDEGIKNISDALKKAGGVNIPVKKESVKEAGKIHASSYIFDTYEVIRLDRIPSKVICDIDDNYDFFTVDNDKYIISTSNHFGMSLVPKNKETKISCTLPSKGRNHLKHIHITSVLFGHCLEAIKLFNKEWEGWDDGTEIKWKKK